MGLVHPKEMTPRGPILGFAVLVVAAAVLSAGATNAGAATIGTDPPDGHSLSGIVYRAAVGEANDVSFASNTCPSWGLCAEERAGAPLKAGPGCELVEPSVVLCAEPYPWPSTRQVRVVLNDGDDVVFDESLFNLGTVFGGAGDDRVDVESAGSLGGKSPTLYGGSGDDALTVANTGGGHPSLYGGLGDDRLSSLCGRHTCGQTYGGAGDDYIVSENLADARLAGERGNDTYTFSSNGWPGYVPRLIVPGPGFDTLDGSAAGSWGAQVDLRGCGQCAERLIGSPSSDTLIGTSGRQMIYGGDSPDHLVGSTGPDFLAGQGGPDFIHSRDASIDTVLCGPDTDTVVADRFDDIRAGCESVSLR